MTNKTGHGKNKVSYVDIKTLCPLSHPAPFGELEYRASDEIQNGQPTVTWWVGKRYDSCEERWSITLTQARQKKFEIPGVPYKFIIVNGEIYYRAIGLVG